MTEKTENQEKKGGLGKRVLAWIILILCILLIINLFGGIFIGLIKTLFTIGLAIAIVFGVIWAFRNL
jgi:hypothetical protein